jgi:4'-phosphopantetheinyl transferase EntD
MRIVSRGVVCEYLDHYHRARNHQGFASQLRSRRRSMTISKHWADANLLLMVAPIAELSPSVFPGEASLVATMTPTRRREFVATRHLARLALNEIGEPEAPIPWGSAGEPRWSTDVVGSLSHAREVAAVVLSRRRFCRSVGVDIDDGRPLDERSSRDLMTVREIESVSRCLGLSDQAARGWVRVPGHDGQGSGLMADSVPE